MTDDAIKQRTREILEKNTISGYSKHHQVAFHYMKPSRKRYPYQYFWDTCFHIHTMAALGMADMAKKCMRSLFAMQQADGFVGHILFWKKFLPNRVTDIFQSRPSLRNFFTPHMSALIQPPLAAQTVLRIFRCDGDMAFVSEMHPKLTRYYDWLRRHRVFGDDGLLSTISWFESGMDWKPSYDAVVGFPAGHGNRELFRKVVTVDVKNYLNGYDLQRIYRRGYFSVKDTGTNTIYAQNLSAMATLCRLVGDPEAHRFDSASNTVTHGILNKMYDTETHAFYDLSGSDDRKLKVLTPTIFFPAILKGIPDSLVKAVIEKHLFNRHEFAVSYPIPSVAINEPAFNPGESRYIWRGPTWVVYNWFLHQCLAERGYSGEATKMVNTIKELIGKSGFREYYDPFTGKGYGARDFTWSGLVVDMMAMENERRTAPQKAV